MKLNWILDPSWSYLGVDFKTVLTTTKLREIVEEWKHDCLSTGRPRFKSCWRRIWWNESKNECIKDTSLKETQNARSCWFWTPAVTKVKNLCNADGQVTSSSTSDQPPKRPIKEISLWGSQLLPEALSTWTKGQGSWNWNRRPADNFLIKKIEDFSRKKFI